MPRMRKLKDKDRDSELFDFRAWGVASMRFGGSYPQRAKRVLYWINRPLGSFTKEDWETLRYEISALADTQYGLTPDEREGLTEHSFTFRPFSVDHASPKSLFRTPNQVSAQHFLEVVSEFVNKLAEGHSVEVGPLSLTVLITRKTTHLDPTSMEKMVYLSGKTVYKKREASPHFPKIIDQAIYQLVKALQACGGLVSRCPECAQLFLGDRINQKYCSPKCLSRVTTRRSRSSQQEVKKTAKDRKVAHKRVVKRSSRKKT